MNTSRTALYRHYNSASELLYVGISLSATYRFKQHQRSAQWIADAVRMETQWFATRKEAEAAERSAIKIENPKFNVAHTIEKNTATKLKPAKPRRKVKHLKSVMCEFEDFTINGQRVFLACTALAKERNGQFTMEGDFKVTPQYYAKMFNMPINTAVNDLNFGAHDLCHGKTIKECLGSNENIEFRQTKLGWLDYLDVYDEPDEITLGFRASWLRKQQAAA